MKGRQTGLGGDDAAGSRDRRKQRSEDIAAAEYPWKPALSASSGQTSGSGAEGDTKKEVSV